MERRNVEKAIDIYAALMMGEEIKSDRGVNQRGQPHIRIQQ